MVWWLPVLSAVTACVFLFFYPYRKRREEDFPATGCLPVWHLLLSLVALHLAAQTSYLLSRISGFWEGLTGIVGLV